jgi:predicted oxidoreductase (fatty acid repression mutant protein)
MARHSRLYSSITFKSFRILLSDVWSNWKSSAQMTFGAIGHMSPNQHLDVTEREFHLTE